MKKQRLWMTLVESQNVEGRGKRPVARKTRGEDGLGRPKKRGGFGSRRLEPPSSLKMLSDGNGCWCSFMCFRMQVNFHAFTIFIFMLCDQTLFFSFTIVWICQTLILGEGDEGFALTTFGSCRPNTESANHIALSRVIGSPTVSRVGGWKCFLYHLCPLLNVLLSI
ncbi:unnamed protein product [Cuscuta epithymum]|uniref:Transmembrane protein n=1 Tax=Cuscuta epithymum TaxID=186058 RepID=A0AAV0DLX2_9ASTE|nr:unnamed protein product [Cuscuta epithymum]